MKKTAFLLSLALTFTSALTACGQPDSVPAPAPAIAPSEHTAAETRAPDPIVTGSCGPITTVPVTTADPNAPIETITHHIDPTVTIPPFTTAPVDPSEPLEAVPSFTVEPVTDRSTEVRFTMNNQTGKIVWTANTSFPLKLEQKVNGEWISVPVMPGIVKHMEIFSPWRTVHGESRKYSYDIVGTCGRFLEPGEYRIPFTYTISDTIGQTTKGWTETYVIFSVTAAPDAAPLAPIPDAPGTVTLDFAANPADTHGMLYLRVTDTTGRQVNLSASAADTLERRKGDAWVTLESHPVEQTERVNIESKSSPFIKGIDPNGSRLFVFSLERYSPLAPGEYRVAVRYGLSDPAAAEPNQRYQSTEWFTAAWHFTVTE